MKKNTILQSERMNLLPSYIFKEIDMLKAKRLSEKRRVIDLAMGNPIDPTPQHVINTLCSHIQKPENHRYPVSSGIGALKKEICNFYATEFGVTLEEDEVICTIGSKEGISHLMLALVDSKDLVLVPSPSFPPHAFGAIIAGARIRKIPVFDETFFLDSVEKICSHETCSLVLLNYLHNPTGKVVNLDFFYRMIDLAKKYNFFIIHDFAYSKLTFDNFISPSFLKAKGGREVGVEFGTFSKSFNMAGWRMGYCVGNREMVAALTKIKGYFDYGIFSPIQLAGITALKNCKDELEEQVKRYQKRRDIVCKVLINGGYEVNIPGGGMFCWCKIPATYQGGKSTEFVKDLLEMTGILVTPGKAFGEEADGYFRLALVEQEDVIRDATELLVNTFPG